MFVWKKETASAIIGGIRVLKLQKLFTENWNIAHKNGFYYHNQVFMLNLIL